MSHPVRSSMILRVAPYPGDLVAPLADELLQVDDLQVLVVVEQPHGLLGVEPPPDGLDDVLDLQCHDGILELHVVVDQDLALLGVDIEFDSGNLLEGLLRLPALSDERTHPVCGYPNGSHSSSSSSSSSSSVPLTVSSKTTLSSMTSAPLFLKNALMFLMSLSSSSLAL